MEAYKLSSPTCRWSELGIHPEEDRYGNEFIMASEFPDLPHVAICLHEIVHELYYAEKPCMERLCGALDDALNQLGRRSPDLEPRLMPKPHVTPDSPFFNMAVELAKSINQ